MGQVLGLYHLGATWGSWGCPILPAHMPTGNTPSPSGTGTQQPKGVEEALSWGLGGLWGVRRLGGAPRPLVQVPAVALTGGLGDGGRMWGPHWVACCQACAAPSPSDPSSMGRLGCRGSSPRPTVPWAVPEWGAGRRTPSLPDSLSPHLCLSPGAAAPQWGRWSWGAAPAWVACSPWPWRGPSRSAASWSSAAPASARSTSWRTIATSRPPDSGARASVSAPCRPINPVNEPCWRPLCGMGPRCWLGVVARPGTCWCTCRSGCGDLPRDFFSAWPAGGLGSGTWLCPQGGEPLAATANTCPWQWEAPLPKAASGLDREGLRQVSGRWGSRLGADVLNSKALSFRAPGSFSRKEGGISGTSPYLARLLGRF